MFRFTSYILVAAALCAFFSLYAAADDAPTVCAKSAIVLETSGSIAYEKDSREKLPMASTTKIMTALVAISSSDLSRRITIPSAACGIEGSSVYLREGEIFTMEELLYALLLSSANDAATAIALSVGGSIEAFAGMMNAKARELMLKDTHFTNPHGLDDDGHYTTAYDLARLAAAALRSEEFSSIVSTYKKTIGEGESVRHLVNHNRLLKLYDDALGVKTGYTRTSGRCLVSAAQRGGVRLVCVTLCDPDDWRDHMKLLDFGFSKYESVTLARADSLICKLPCVGGTLSEIPASNRDELNAVLPIDHGEITQTIEAPRFLYSPVESGEHIADAVYRIDGTEIARCALYAKQPSEYLKPKGFFSRLLE